MKSPLKIDAASNIGQDLKHTRSVEGDGTSLLSLLSTAVAFTDNPPKDSSANTPNTAQALLAHQNSGIPIFFFDDLSGISLLAEGEFSRAFCAGLKYGSSTDTDGNTGAMRNVVVKVPKGKPGQNEWSELNCFLRVPSHRNILPFLGMMRDFKHDGVKHAFSIITARQEGSLKEVDKYVCFFLPP